MIIKSIYIKEFGSISDREIVLDDGLNIIEGENESGKSTLLSFIKFMLYGLPKKAAGEIVTEKERAFSWSGAVAEGSMTVETAQGLFRIERGAKASSRTETPKIYDAETGEQVYKGENPGELFFGLPMNVFESTACVKQLKCTQLDGSGLGSSIENLMVAADENMSVKKAVAKLDSLRKRLMHKNRRGGEISELEDMVSALEARLRDSSDKARRLYDRECAIESAERIIAEAREKVAEEKALSRAYDLRQTQIRFDALHSSEKRVESLKIQEKEALEGGGFGGRLPAESEISTLSECRMRYLQARENRIQAEEGYAELKHRRPDDDRTDADGAQMTDEGGERAVIERYAVRMKKAGNAKKAGVLLTVLAVISAVFGALAFASGRFIPRILPFTGKAKMICLACALAVCILSAAFAILNFVRSGKLKKENGAYAGRFGCETNDRESLVIRLAALRHRIAERESFDALLDRADGSRIKCSEEERAAYGALVLSLNALCPGEAPDGETVASKAAELAERYRALAAEVGEIRRDMDKYSALADERRGELSQYNEDEIRRAVTPELLEQLANVNITLLRRDLEFQQARLESAVSKQQTAERELITLRATSEDSAKLRAKLQEQKKLLESRRFMLDSLTLASESISEGSDQVRRSITPMLKKQAGEHLGRLTGGKYTELSVSPDFTVSVMADGVTRPVEALSSGTRDAVYLAIRLALVSVLYRNEKPALLLDEVLTQIDDKRAKNILAMLAEHSERGTQCLLFTCHTRESSMMNGVNRVRM